jgi:hypothetical protein
VTFTNPLPAGAIAVSFKAEVFGSWSCDPTLSSSMFGMQLNGLTHFVIETAETSTNCRCDTCDNSVFTQVDYRNGLPALVGGTNRVTLQPYRNSLCVNRIVVSIGYNRQPGSELPYVFQELPFNPLADNSSACAVCNSGKKGTSTWCSSSAGGASLSFSFQDPVPAGAVLVAFDAYASYNYESSVYINYYSRLGFYLAETITAEATVYTTGWRGTKCGCLGNIVLQSPFYQRGWPNYRYGSTNTLRMTITRTYSSSYGNVCVGRLYGSFVYYFLDDAERTLHRIGLDGSPVLDA